MGGGLRWRVKKAAELPFGLCYRWKEYRITRDPELSLTPGNPRLHPLPRREY